MFAREMNTNCDFEPKISFRYKMQYWLPLATGQITSLQKIARIIFVHEHIMDFHNAKSTKGVIRYVLNSVV